MKKFPYSLLNTLKKRKVKQIGSLYTSMMLGIIFGIGVSVVNTRLLGPQQYGDLKFLQNLFGFVVTFSTLGIFVSGCRLVAQKKNTSIKHELIGNLLVLASVISIVLIIGFFIFSFYEEHIFNNRLGKVIRIFSPLLFVFPFKICLGKIMQGDNRIYELSIFNISPQALYLVFAILFNYFIPLSLTSALLIQFLALALLISIMIIRFRPKLNNFKKNCSIIWEENKTYGLKVYIGALAGVASGQLGGLAIGYYLDNTSVGFFSLAIMTTQPLNMIPGAVATTFFKDFTELNSLPRKINYLNFLLASIALILFLIIIKRVIVVLYSQEYIAAVSLAYLISIGQYFLGFGEYINRFLGAHGRGRELLHGSIAIGISNVLGYLILVRMYGVKGAALTRGVSGIIYFAVMYYYYIKFKEVNVNERVEK